MTSKMLGFVLGVAGLSFVVIHSLHSSASPELSCSSQETKDVITNIYKYKKYHMVIPSLTPDNKEEYLKSIEESKSVTPQFEVTNTRAKKKNDLGNLTCAADLVNKTSPKYQVSVSKIVYPDSGWIAEFLKHNDSKALVYTVTLMDDKNNFMVEIVK
jgi:hypothetical protein